MEIDTNTSGELPVELLLGMKTNLNWYNVSSNSLSVVCLGKVRQMQKAVMVALWLGFDFTATDSIRRCVFTDTLAQRWLHLSFLSV